MRALPCVLSASLFLIGPLLYADYPNGYNPSWAVSACITAATGSCNDPESPVVVYNDSWNGAFSGTITFTPFSNGSLPDTQTYDATVGTLNNPLSNIGNNLIMTATSEENGEVEGRDYFELNQTPTNPTPIPYQVFYQDCTTETPVELVPTVPTNFNSASASFVDKNPGIKSSAPCHPEDEGEPGSGSGQLSFKIVNPTGVMFGGGPYSASVTITICTNNGICL